MTRFLHITDLHITAPLTDDPTQQSDTRAAFDALLAAADRLNPRPAFIVASGDLTNIGDEASYQWLSNRLARCDIPVVMTLGNHDRRRSWHKVFAGHAAAPDGPVDHDTVLAGMHIIALDSSLPGKVSGGLSEDQIAHAKTMFARHPELPKVVVVHHPPRLDPTARFAWATLDQDSSDALAALLRGHNIAALLCGHIHMNRFAMWHGVPLIVNTGLQSSIDVTRSDALSVIEGTGFAICDHLDGGIRATFASLSDPVVIKEISAERLRAFS